MPDFKRNQRIEATGPGGKVVTGYVHSAAGGKVAMRLDTGGVTKAQPARIFRASNAPPPATGAPREWKAKDRADFTDGDGVVRHGTLKSAGTKATVVLDGGKEEYRVPVGLLRECTKPATTHPADPMDAWAVTSYRPVAAMSEETVAYTAKVTKDGRHVLDARNDGHGGCDMFHPVSNARGAAADFLAAATDWFARHGKEKAFEPDSGYVEWYATRRPYGCTAAEYVRELMSDEESFRLEVGKAHVEDPDTAPAP